MLYMIPNPSRIEESLQLAETYQANFEYNDFFLPRVYEDPDNIRQRIAFYRILGRDTRNDTLHGAFLDITPHSEDTGIRELSKTRVLQSMDIAAELELRAVIFHTNTIPNFRTASYVKHWTDANEAWIRQLLSRYPGIEIYYENMFDMVPDDLAALAERLKDEPRFGVCLDYAHATVFGKGQPWAEKLGAYTKHLHINDNDGAVDLHLAVGDGTIDWKAYDQNIRRFTREPSVLIETSNPEKFLSSVRYLKDKGFYPFPEAKGGTAC